MTPASLLTDVLTAVVTVLAAGVPIHVGVNIIRSF